MDPIDDTTPLTLRQTQAEVDATIRALGGYWPPLANLARLFEECGERGQQVQIDHFEMRHVHDNYSNYLLDAWSRNVAAWCRENSRPTQKES